MSASSTKIVQEATIKATIATRLIKLTKLFTLSIVKAMVIKDNGVDVVKIE